MSRSQTAAPQIHTPQGRGAGAFERAGLAWDEFFERMIRGRLTELQFEAS